MPSLNTKLATAPNVSANYVLKATTSTTIGNSLIFDNGTNVGISTITPAEKLSINGNILLDKAISSSVYSEIRARYLNDNNCQSSIRFYNPDNGFGGDMRFYTQPNTNGAANTERMRIASGGNILIGTTSDNGAKLQVNGQATINGIGVNRTLNAGWATYSAIEMNPYSSIFAGDDGFRAYTAYTFGVYSGSGWSPKYILSGSYVNAYRQRDGAHEFLTAGAGTAGNAITFTNVMNITNTGNVGIGNTGESFIKLRITGISNTSSDYSISCTSANGTDTMWVRNDGAGYLKASSWTYGSDRRIKENINYIETGLDKVLALKPATFDYIDGIKNNIGWIAQDVQEVIPEAVCELSDTNDQLTLKSDFIVPYLVKAIQELNQKIQDQQQTINSLINR